MFTKDNRRISHAAYIIFNLLTVSSLFLYLLFSAQEQSRNYNIKTSMKVYSQIEKGEQFPILEIAYINDGDGFTHNTSNIGKLYEPLFGYGLEYFKPLVKTGSIFEVEDGYYNMTNPASYVFPKENELQPFERFRVDQKESLELFANHRQPFFKISMGQKIANILSMTTLVALCLYLMFITASAISVYFPRPAVNKFGTNLINNSKDFE